MGERTWPQLISALLRRDELTTGDTAWAMDEIMAGAATPTQITAFAIALRAKGETSAEVVGLAAAMLEHAAEVPVPDDVRASAVDIVGTGGDQAHTVNISTMAAMVLAGAGIPVIKHGNRAATSSCGAADLLEHLGIPLDLTGADVAACVREIGIGFCFAPVFHSGLRHAAVARREMGVPTAFNFLGPLTNPGRPRSAAVGCADARMAPILAGVFAARGDSVIVVRGEDGLDEFTTAGPTRLWIATGREAGFTGSIGGVRETVLDAVDLGIARSAPGDLRGADAAFNGDVARRLIEGEPGPVQDAVMVNAAVAIVAHAARTAPETLATDDAVSDAMRAGIARARSSIEAGETAIVLARWIHLARELKSAANAKSRIVRP